MTKYKRILLKLSGESLMEHDRYGISSDRLIQYGNQIKEVATLGIEVGIVIGGGNIFRGLQGEKAGLDRVVGDQMGMLATIINGLALRSTLEEIGLKTSLFTAIQIESVGIGYSPQKARESLNRGEVIIISGGTGNPFFTTDTAATLRAVEIGAEVIIKATKVDGVYDKDPAKYSDAVKLSELTYDQALQDHIKVMDDTSIALAKDNRLPIIVCNMAKQGNLLDILNGNMSNCSIVK